VTKLSCHKNLQKVERNSIRTHLEHCVKHFQGSVPRIGGLYLVVSLGLKQEKSFEINKLRSKMSFVAIVPGKKRTCRRARPLTNTENL
jgi:hypothetical protein